MDEVETISETELSARERLAARLEARDNDSEFDTLLNAEDTPKITEPIQKSGPGWPALAVMSLLASLLGTLGGWTAARHLDAQLPNTNLALADLETTQTNLRSRLDTLESRETPAPDLSSIESRLTALETRLDSKPSVQSTISSPVSTSKTPSALTPALTPALARRLAEMDRRLTALESAPAVASTQIVRPLSTLTSTTPLPDFPLKAVEDALNTRRGSALGRVIGIRRAQDSDTLVALKSALDNNDLAGALTAFDDLPLAAQDAAADWATFARTRLTTESPR